MNLDYSTSDYFRLSQSNSSFAAEIVNSKCHFVSPKYRFIKLFNVCNYFSIYQIVFSVIVFCALSNHLWKWIYIISVTCENDAKKIIRYLCTGDTVISDVTFKPLNRNWLLFSVTWPRFNKLWLSLNVIRQRHILLCSSSASGSGNRVVRLYLYLTVRDAALLCFLVKNVSK